ncbi:MAG: hypothetical protein ABJB66_01390 [Gemmatimonadaceae bacterium]
MSKIPEQFQKELGQFPDKMRELLDAELVAGNSILQITHGHPAPPIGACVMLARAVSTRLRQTGAGLKFRAANSSLYSGQFSDLDERYFILEAPLPPPEELSMDAIRDAHNARSAPGNYKAKEVEKTGNTLVDEFRASMHIDYEKWHDGIGFEVRLLAKATDAEKNLILPHLIPASGWREVEALAAINNEKAVAALRKAAQNGTAEVRTAITRYAPWVVSDDERTELLLDALQHAAFYGGLTSALDQVAEFHPPKIVDALFRGLFERKGEIATHYAAMLVYVHGKSDDIFDWDRRPLFLRFNDDDGAARRRAFPELCEILGVDPDEKLKSLDM